jgi:hypothetical protein
MLSVFDIHMHVKGAFFGCFLCLFKGDIFSKIIRLKAPLTGIWSFVEERQNVANTFKNQHMCRKYSSR